VGFEYFLRGPDNTLWGRPWSQSQSGLLQAIGGDVMRTLLGPAKSCSPVIIFFKSAPNGPLVAGRPPCDVNQILLLNAAK
jgi:hypothetical protein